MRICWSTVSFCRRHDSLFFAEQSYTYHQKSCRSPVIAKNISLRNSVSRWSRGHSVFEKPVFHWTDGEHEGRIPSRKGKVLTTRFCSARGLSRNAEACHALFPSKISMRILTKTLRRSGVLCLLFLSFLRRQTPGVSRRYSFSFSGMSPTARF